jgi:hypothetical protein
MKRNTTKLTRLAVAAAVLVAAVAATCRPADAAVNAHLENVTSKTSCNASTGRITLAASIMLTNAYANTGAWVSYRFRYYGVNASGQRTTQFYGGSWLGPYKVSTWKQTGDYWSGGALMNDPVELRGGSVTFRGRLDTQVEIAVWTGSAYAHTGWMNVNSHQTHYASPYGPRVLTASECYTSL